MTVVKDENGKYPPVSRHLTVRLNGQDVTRICHGFSEEEGWCDLLIKTGGKVMPMWVLDEDRKPLVTRVKGRVQATDNRNATGVEG